MNGSLDPAKVAEFSKALEGAGSIGDARDGLYIDYQALDRKPFDAIMFFTKYAHERPFTNPYYPLAHRISILKAIGVSDAKDPTANDKFAANCCEPKFPEEVWNEFKRLLKFADKSPKTQKTMEGYTRGPVRTILDKLEEESEPNIIAFLAQKTLKEAYDYLKTLDGIGHKIAALFLRDARVEIGGWAEDCDLYCVQPVDRWVERLAAMCWLDFNRKQNVEKKADDIVKRCHQQGIDPIAFNRGAWMLGAHFQKLCGFFNIATTMRLSDQGDLNTEAIGRFDPAEIKRAIETLRKAESATRMYPL